MRPWKGPHQIFPKPPDGACCVSFPRYQQNLLGNSFQKMLLIFPQKFCTHDSFKYNTRTQNRKRKRARSVFRIFAEKSAGLVVFFIQTETEKKGEKKENVHRLRSEETKKRRAKKTTFGFRFTTLLIYYLGVSFGIYATHPKPSRP